MSAARNDRLIHQTSPPRTSPMKTLKQMTAPFICNFHSIKIVYPLLFGPVLRGYD